MNIGSQAFYAQPVLNQMTEKQYIQYGMTYFLMNLMQDPTVKNFYQNQVLKLKFLKLENYQDVSKVKIFFDSVSDMNNPSFDVDGMENAVFYILRSTCDDDIHKAIKYGFWTSTHKNNVTLNSLYRKCSKKGIPIYLFFTVVKSF